MSGKFKVMIVGLGDLGWWVLEFLSRAPGPFEIVTADRDEDLGIRRTHSALLGSYQMGFDPKVTFRKVDLNDIDATADVIREVRPDLIYNSTTLQSWWVVAELPKEAHEALDRARYGPWLPMHLLLTHKLMLAVKASGIDCKVVNAAFPDAVNPVLAKIGLAPTVGIGNIDNVIPALTRLAADALGVHPRSVQVYMLAPHFVSYHIARFGDAGGAPFHLRFLLDDRDVTAELDVRSILAGVPTTYKRPGGRGAHPLVASSVVKIILGIMNDTGQLSHAPGPNGLPGGYPVRLSSRGVDVVVPSKMTLDECVKINESAQRFDGIEHINEDGSVVFTEESYAIMKDLLGYDCRTLKVEECEDRARELDARFKAYLARFK